MSYSATVYSISYEHIINKGVITKELHQIATEHGWWDEPRSFGEIIALCHSELSEALEEYRNGKPLLYCAEKDGDWCNGSGADGMSCEECYRIRAESGKLPHKPEGAAVEMIDCIIRILDWCGKENIDVEKILRIKIDYNKIRPYKHGGKVI